MERDGRRSSLSFICPPGVLHVLSESFLHLPLWPIFRQSHPNFITVRTTYASKIWAQLTKNLLTRSGTERFRENIFLQNQAQKASGRTFMAMSSLGGRSDYEMRQRKARIQNMRKMGSDGQLKRMICNACGKKLAVKQGIVLEGVISVDHTWDYFSEKDGQTDHFDLCEECYDQMTAAFKIAVETEEQTEYL